VAPESAASVRPYDLTCAAAYGALDLTVSSSERRRLHSGLLDALVERITRSTNSSAVFVCAESTATGASLLAEFPFAAASIALDRHASDGASASPWPDGQVVAAPVRAGQTVTGWAAAVGPSLDHDREAHELVTLLAQCAGVLLDRQSANGVGEETRPRWEDAARTDTGSGTSRPALCATRAGAFRSWITET